MSAVPHKGPEADSDPAYPFYVTSQTHVQGKANHIERTLYKSIALIEEQCGSIPKEIELRGRMYHKVLKEHGTYGDLLSSSYGYNEFYTGSILTTEKPYLWRHDFPKIAEATVEIHKLRLAEFQSGQAKYAQYKADRRERAAQGLLLIIGAAYSMYDSSICNDPKIEKKDKPIYCE